jgi:hypothetical protein
MADVAALTLDDFTGHVGEPFAIGPLAGPDGEPITVEVHLHEAEALGPDPGDGRRTPFSLVFTGPMDRMLSQGTARLDHATLGVLELFVVPVQPQDGQAHYQSVFN